MKSIFKLLSIAIIFIITISTFTFSQNDVQAKAEISKYNILTDGEGHIYVTTNKNKVIHLYFENNKIYTGSYWYGEDSPSQKLANNLTIKLANKKTIQIKKGKLYSKGKLYTGKLKTAQTLVKPFSGKSYFYMNVTVKKDIIKSGKNYMIDNNSMWAG